MSRSLVISISIITLLSLPACRESTDQPLALGLREVAELGTLEVHFGKIVYGEKQTKERFLFIQTGSSRASHVAKSEAVLTLGIDINDLAADDVKVTGDRISVLLPPVEIIDFDYDPTRFQVQKQLPVHRKGLVTATEATFSVREIERTYRQAEQQVREQLPYSRLQRMAERRTAMFFREYLKHAGFREVFVTFKEGDLSSFNEGGTK